MKAGQTIGRYRIERLLGSGAMGEVYAAYDPIIDRPVAIKLVRPELTSGSGSEHWLERFRREARAAGRRFHPNIVAIWDFGDDDGTPFLVMEYVEGRSLDDVIRSSGLIEPRRAVGVMAQVLSALGFAHENGIVHRDVKPSNIMLLDTGAVKVADFGIARIDASEFTIVGDLLGTPAYMAPEQLSGAPVDHRADLFAAGVILFEMLTGVKPFRGKSITENMSLMEKRGPEDIRALNPGVPDVLKRAIAKSLAFHPAERYGAAAEFAKAIAEAARVPAGQQPQTSALPARLQPELIREIERDLAALIGPMASVALRRALARTDDLLALYDLLGRQLDNPRDRAAFLARGRRRAAAESNRPQPTLPKTSGTSQPGPDRPVPASARANVVAIERDLARYIGPIARVLVRKELEKFETLAKFCRRLAAHIPDERDRKAFLSDHGAL